MRSSPILPVGPDSFRAGRLWSLGDMLNFQVKPLFGLLAMLEAHQRSAEAWLSIPAASMPNPSLASAKFGDRRQSPQPAKQEIPESTKIEMRVLLKAATDIIARIELAGALDRIDIFERK